MRWSGLSEWVEKRPEQDAHVYIVSSAGTLVGGIDLQSLVLSRRTSPLSSIIKPARFVSVNFGLDELEVCSSATSSCGSGG